MTSRNHGKKKSPTGRTLDALPDSIDFRDVMYVPSLVRVSPSSDLKKYRSAKVPVLDQGQEGACTGYGLATVANYLLRVRAKQPNAPEVSPRMFYVVAKRYDEWPGEKYEGSSARGAMKGWHKHGVCALSKFGNSASDGILTEAQVKDALKRPLGAYFRVNHKDLVAMHAAITEAGVLYATSTVHEGWDNVGPNGFIPYRPGATGGHAFAIVGYDDEGFWIQNSWGKDWGAAGLARITYADWLANGTDVWVAALGVPMEMRIQSAQASMRSGAPRSYESYVYSALRPHVVMCRNDGELDDHGTYGLTQEALKNIIENDLPATVKKWGKKRVVLHAHGGLVGEDSALQHVADAREPLLKAQVYPISFIWRSDVWSTMEDILQDAVAKRRDEGVLDRAKDFMLDRIDDTLEVVARHLGGKTLWDEMKENARLAAEGAKGGARLTADHISRIIDKKLIDEVHLVGHSAGSIMLGSLAQYLAGMGVTIASLSLWAPACSLDFFKKTYRPLIEKGAIKAFDLYTLDDATEQDDDCAGIYHKSLLYLVSGAFEETPHIPAIQKGQSLLGLERDVASEIEDGFWKNQNRIWYRAPGAPESKARHHGDFDDDPVTLGSTLNRILGSNISTGQFLVRRLSPTARSRVRRTLDVVPVQLGHRYYNGRAWNL